MAALRLLSLAICCLMLGATAADAKKDAEKVDVPPGQAKKLPSVAAPQVTSNAVAQSATNVGVTATSALRDAMKNAHSLVEGDMDLQPKIRPVLDLSEIKKDATKISDHMPPIDLSAAYAHAKSAKFGFDKTRIPGDTPPEAGGPKQELNYTQNNYSPKALSRAEIYRQTKNQLSTVKGALNT